LKIGIAMFIGIFRTTGAILRERGSWVQKMIAPYD